MTLRAFPFVLVCSFSVAAQTPYLVKDINTTLSLTTESSSPRDFVVHRGRTYFVATTDAAGTELWSTDGTSGGTSLFADIVPGSGSSNPAALKVFGDTLFFNARDADHGIELWVTDGTTSGTRRLIDINPGPGSSQPGARVIYRNRMLFSADDGVNGRELWITDGTVAGTRMLKDLNPGSASSSPSDYTLLGDTLYFLADGGLWKTDGTDAGTVKIASVGARGLRAAGAQLFFEGFNVAGNWELWVSDGTEAGTRMVADLIPGEHGALQHRSNVPAITPLGGRVLFLANDGVHGRELWISDGTSAGTHIVRDLAPGADGMWDDRLPNFATLGNHVYFAAKDDEHGSELWVTDGTEAGTTMFADLTTGTASSTPYSLTVTGEKLFFAFGNDIEYGARLGVSDGTIAGTRIVSGATLFGTGLLWAAGGGTIYFEGHTPLTGGEPWVSDGTDAGTRIIANIEADGAPSSSPLFLTAAGGLLFFYATEGRSSPSAHIDAMSLWRSDGTEAGTYKLAESGQRPPTLMPCGSLVFFSDPINGDTWMMSDGTIFGTRPANDFLRRFNGEQMTSCYPLGNELLAVADKTLWKTADGPFGPAVGLGSEDPFGFVEVAGHYVFYADALFYPYSLWATDGTPAGTYPLMPEFVVAVPKPGTLVNAAGTLFFLTGWDGSYTTLWKGDGTLDGTRAVVKKLPSGTSRSEIVAAGHRVFFFAEDSLWTSDGTEAGTLALANVKLSVLTRNRNLTAVGNRVVFPQYTETTGFDLWVSDGTAAGTKRVRNLPREVPQLVAIDGQVYFAAADDEHGNEIWTTDGTEEGTKLLFDLNPGPAGSHPSGFTKAGDRVYFSAYRDDTGTELWAIPPSESISIGDARATEGGIVRFKVTLNPQAAQPVTMHYSTTDGTARASEDYDAAAGTLIFAPGETVKTIDVQLRSDAAAENQETLFVELSNASGARVIRSEGTGIIEDDDQAADLAAGLDFDQYNYYYVTVANHGPRAATMIAIDVHATPAVDGSQCRHCRVIPQLVSGGSNWVPGDKQWPSEQVYMSATATAHVRDPQRSNDTVTWTMTPSRNMVMTPAFLTEGQSTTVRAQVSETSPAVASSDPSVVSISSPITFIRSGVISFMVTAQKAGTATISAGNRALLVTVVAPGATPRWPGAMRSGIAESSVTLDKPLRITVTPAGRAPVSGLTATGEVIVSVDDQEVVRRTIVSAEALEFPVYFTSTGAKRYRIDYSGDTNFLPQTFTGTTVAYRGRVSIEGVLQRVSDSPGTFAMHLHIVGSPVVAPTGEVVVLHGATEIARTTLVHSNAEMILTNLPESPSLTVTYLGNDSYEPRSRRIDVTQTHRRSVRH